MTRLQDKPVLIAGAGIAGLTAALAFASRGFDVHLFERAESLEEVGAGLQLSPNATRILRGLGVLPHLATLAVSPEAVVLREARSLDEVARVPLGAFAERRWGAPYLVAHRADLQSALLTAVRNHPGIELATGTTVRDFALSPEGAGFTIEHEGRTRDIRGSLAVAADGVWSTLRALAGEVGKSRFIGQLAWRRTLESDSAEARALLAACPGVTVNAFLHPGFHLITYPLRGGAQINLAAFTPTKREMETGWTRSMEIAPLRAAMTHTHPVLAALAAPGTSWTAWPIHIADLDGAWIDPGGLALIGDAAHAMTPFAAQGAAMAIEDAETLAAAVAANPGQLESTLEGWAIARRRRVLRVARRGALNQFAWHAKGPVAIARNAFLKLRGPESLAADLDWLYGWKPSTH